MFNDKSDRTLFYLLIGTRGGPTRIQIIGLLLSRPSNANKIAEILGLDYKTVRRHIEILQENGIISVSKESRYGEIYFITDFAKERLKPFDKIFNKLKIDDLG